MSTQFNNVNLKKRPRKALKITGVFLLLIFSLVITAHIALEKHFAKLVRQEVLPWLKVKYQTDIRLKKISINLVTGVLLIDGIVVDQSTSEQPVEILNFPRLRIRLALSDLWREKAISLRSFSARDGQLNLTRRADGRLNITSMEQPESPSQTPVSSSVSSSVVKENKTADFATPAQLQKLALNRAGLSFSICYQDYSPIFQPNPLVLNFDLNLALNQIANYGRTDQLSGNLLVKGMLHSDNQPTPFELRGKIAPILNFQQLNFTLAGSTKYVYLSDIPALANYLQLEAGQAACNLSLTVKDSIIDQKKSMLTFNFQDIKFRPEAPKNYHKIALSRSFNLKVPVKGNLLNPQLDFTAALAHLLTSDNVIDSFLQEIFQANPKSKNE